MQEDTYLDEHLVRYQDLIPCTTAFIDTRTPGSSEKENFTIIGPGVSEHPDQHVHITRPHGFNIGGARQPPHCVNSQHSHETAEVFVVHTGEWRFTSGEKGGDGEVLLSPGDTISIPTRCFRGFENVGTTEGFLFAVLGGDDPGRVTWAPYVFENAQKYGLVLLENGNLIDTAAGEVLPENISVMPATTAEDVETMQKLNSQALEACVVKHGQHSFLHSPLGKGILEAPLIGSAVHEASGDQARPALNWEHGFQLRHLILEPGVQSHTYSSNKEEVLFVQRGSVSIATHGRTIDLSMGDVLSLEIDEPRRMINTSHERSEVYSVHGGNSAAINIEA